MQAPWVDRRKARPMLEQDRCRKARPTDRAKLGHRPAVAGHSEVLACCYSVDYLASMVAQLANGHLRIAHRRIVSRVRRFRGEEPLAKASKKWGRRITPTPKTHG